MIGTEPRIGFQEFRKAPNQQPGSDQQDQRQGKFYGNEKTLEAKPAGSAAAPALLKRGMKGHRRYLERRNQSEENSRQEGGSEHKNDHASSHGNVARQRDAFRHEREQQGLDPGGEREP